MITPPQQGQPVEDLWRIVLQCVEVVNALHNMRVVVISPDPTQGKIEIHGGYSVMTLF